MKKNWIVTDELTIQPFIGVEHRGEPNGTRANVIKIRVHWKNAKFKKKL